MATTRRIAEEVTAQEWVRTPGQGAEPASRVCEDVAREATLVETLPVDLGRGNAGVADESRPEHRGEPARVVPSGATPPALADRARAVAVGYSGGKAGGTLAGARE